ncbi:RusA-like Holliday junction resolvase [Ralstonia phage PQ43W]
MTAPLTLRLPWPPSVNRIWRAVGGRVLLSSAARRYCKQAANALPRGRAEPLTGRLVVWLHLCPPATLGSVWDIANREKLVADVLTQQRVWLDDSQIDIITIVRGEPVPQGHVDILIHTL